MKIKTQHGWSIFRGIKKINVNHLLHITFNTGRVFKCTPDHIIYKEPDLPIWADMYDIGEQILINDIYETIVNIEHLYGEFEVYDILHVDNHNSYLCSDISVSNCEEFWISNYPALSAFKHSKVIIISTPRGKFNLFYDIYNEARTVQEKIEYDNAIESGDEKLIAEVKDKQGKKNGFICAKFDWRVVPDRDEKWAETERANVGDVKFEQEYNVSFVGSIYTLIIPETLERIEKEVREPEQISLNGRFRIFEQPKDRIKYIIGVDPAKGTGKDASCMQVLKICSINPIKLEQVAVFEDNKTDTYIFSQILNKIGLWYNNALLMIENNGEGSAVISQMWWTHEYQNMYNYGSKASKLGVHANASTKTQAILLMKKFIEQKFMQLNDYATVKQLAIFIETDSGAFKGQDNAHDDLVSSLYWACYALSLDLWDENINLIEESTEDDAWGILSDINSDNTDWEF